MSLIAWLRNLWRPAPEPTPGPEPAPEPTDLAGLRTALLAAHNRERAQRGYSPLELNDACCRAAQKHSDYQARVRRMTHTGEGRSGVAQRLAWEGYPYRSVGENVAWNYPSVAAVVKGWMWSPGHRANILGRSYKHVGFGLARGPQGDPYWTTVFAAPNQPGLAPQTEVEVNLSGPLTTGV